MSDGWTDADEETHQHVYGPNHMKPAEPVTEAGKANNWMPADDGGVQYARISKPRVALIEAQAQALILSDVEGLARALLGPIHRRPDEARRHAQAVLEAWREERAK